MEQHGHVAIAAPREAVWNALNDPAVLQQCIDGCEHFVSQSEGRYVATVRARVGPVSATFKGEIQLKDLIAPQSYTLVGSGAGGAAGFARGEARVSLLEIDDQHTRLEYTLQANVGGKLAQVGSRLIDGAARKMADDFFARFRAVIETPLQSGDRQAADSQGVDGPNAASAQPQHSDLPSTSAAGVESTSRYEPTGQATIWWIVVGVFALALALALIR